MGKNTLLLTVFKTTVWYIIYRIVKAKVATCQKNSETERLSERFIDQIWKLIPTITDLSKLVNITSFISLQLTDVREFRANTNPIYYAKIHIA